MFVHSNNSSVEGEWKEAFKTLANTTTTNQIQLGQCKYSPLPKVLILSQFNATWLSYRTSLIFLLNIQYDRQTWFRS